jgi:hypothetical protein
VSDDATATATAEHDQQHDHAPPDGPAVDPAAVVHATPGGSAPAVVHDAPAAEAPRFYMERTPAADNAEGVAFKAWTVYRGQTLTVEGLRVDAPSYDRAPAEHSERVLAAVRQHFGALLRTLDEQAAEAAAAAAPAGSHAS